MGRIKKRSVFYISLFAFLTVLTLNYSGQVLNTVEVFRWNKEIEKIEEQGYKSYSVLENTFQFILPSNWNVLEQNFPGSEIIYHLNFLSADKRIHGFIQVWKMDKSLDEFLKESESSSADLTEYKSYSRKEIFVENNRGFLLQYERPNSDGVLHRAYDGFIQGKEGNIYRAGFFMKKRYWKDSNTVVFNKIIKSFNIK